MGEPEFYNSYKVAFQSILLVYSFQEPDLSIHKRKEWRVISQEKGIEVVLITKINTKKIKY